MLHGGPAVTFAAALVVTRRLRFAENADREVFEGEQGPRDGHSLREATRLGPRFETLSLGFLTLKSYGHAKQQQAQVLQLPRLHYGDCREWEHIIVPH